MDGACYSVIRSYIPWSYIGGTRNPVVLRLLLPKKHSYGAKLALDSRSRLLCTLRLASHDFDFFCIYAPTRLCIFSSALPTVGSEMLHVDKADRNNYATFAYAFGCQYAKKLRLIYEYSILIFLYWRGIIFR